MSRTDNDLGIWDCTNTVAASSLSHHHCRRCHEHARVRHDDLLLRYLTWGRISSPPRMRYCKLYAYH